MARGVVVEYDSPAGAERGHERASRAWVAATLARLKSYDHVGPAVNGVLYEAPLYAVPSETLLPEEARRLGVRGADDLFGGVAPHAFVATKSIVHPLVDAEARAPHGWSHALAGALAGDVLPGYAAFTAGDARRAAARALARGPARAKLAKHKGGAGQAVLSRIEELEPLLALESEAELLRFGLVVEEELEELATYSVGRVCVAGLEVSYCGRQRVTTNPAGRQVYGGSDLRLVRGGFDRLALLDLGEAEREAVASAWHFDTATRRAFPGLYHSRSNYDVLRGATASGEVRCGVLEQSWRLGGASAAEAAALLAFRDNPALQWVRASTFEVYGECRPPARARLIYRGDDGEGGRLTKYCTLEMPPEVA
jgi:hypothetical protein